MPPSSLMTPFQGAALPEASRAPGAPAEPGAPGAPRDAAVLGPSRQPARRRDGLALRGGPDFIIIGAAKAGTTTLYDLLEAHPQVAMSRHKEPNFFTEQWARPGRIDWYRSLFPTAVASLPGHSDRAGYPDSDDPGDPAPPRLRGEASVSYTWSTHAPIAARRIASALPRVKLVYILRHPVDRIEAHVREHVKARQMNGEPTAGLSVESVLAQWPFIIGTSEYARVLKVFERYCDPDRVLVLLLEDLHERPDQTLTRLAGFLGIDAQALLDAHARAAAPSNNHADYLRRAAEAELARAAAGLPWLGPCLTRLPPAIKQRLHALAQRLGVKSRLQQQFSLPPMRPATREQLTRHFRPLNDALAQRLGRDLAHWSHLPG